jgi:threonine synthase
VATAHPAKFPRVIEKALRSGRSLPESAFHHSIEEAKKADTKVLICTYKELERLLVDEIDASLKH